MSAIKIGNHAWFMVDGATLITPDTGVSSKTNAPSLTDGSAPVAPWVSIPCLENASVNTEEQGAEEVYCPDSGTGTYSLEEVVAGKVKTVVEITPQDLTPLIAGLIWGASVTLTGAITDFAPGKHASKYGWFVIDQYSHNDVFICRVKAYCKLTVASATEMGDKVVKPKLRLQVLKATANAGIFDLTGADLTA